MSRELKIERLNKNSWAAFDRRGKQIFSIEKKVPECFPEFEIRECLPHAGRGALLVEFLGPEAFSWACKWTQSHSLPGREQESRRYSPRRASGKTSSPRRKATKPAEATRTKHPQAKAK